MFRKTLGAATLLRTGMASVTLVLPVIVVAKLGLSWTHAGFLVGAWVLGGVVGNPLMGWLLDQEWMGLRATIRLCVGIQMVAWIYLAVSGNYLVLVVAAVGAGLFVPPAFNVVPQVINLLPEEQQGRAYTLNSVSLEVAWMVGPLVAVALAPRVGAAVIGGLFVLGCLVLYAVNPPIRGEEPTCTNVTTPRGLRSLLSGGVIRNLVLALALQTFFIGLELGIISTCRSVGASSWTGVVYVIGCLGSLLGLWMYSHVKPMSFASSILLATLLTIPVVLFTASSLVVLVIALVPGSLLLGVCIANGTRELNTLVSDDVRGLAFGTQASAFAFGSVIGAPLAGWSVDQWGPGSSFLVTSLVAAVLVLGVIGLGVDQKKDLQGLRTVG